MFEEQRFEGAVAMMDVLGFNSRTKDLDLAEARDTVIGPLFMAAANTQKIVMEDLRRVPVEFPLEYLFFADTVVLYLPCAADTFFDNRSLVLESMVFACSIMTATSIWLNIPLRGAIAYGECIICRNPLYILGKPFLEAHELELKQNWAGVSLCSSAERYWTARFGQQVVSWEIPLKCGPTQRLAVNWPINSARPNIQTIEAGTIREGPTPDWDSCFSSKSDDVQQKRRNTIAFFDHHKNVDTVGTTIGPEQRQQVGHWQQRLMQGRG